MTGILYATYPRYLWGAETGGRAGRTWGRSLWSVTPGRSVCGHFAANVKLICGHWFGFVKCHRTDRAPSRSIESREPTSSLANGMALEEAVIVVALQATGPVVVCSACQPASLHTGVTHFSFPGSKGHSLSLQERKHSSLSRSTYRNIQNIPYIY